MPPTTPRELLYQLSRPTLVRLLESISIECYDDESDATLAEAVYANLQDGTLDPNDFDGLNEDLDAQETLEALRLMLQHHEYNSDGPPPVAGDALELLGSLPSTDALLALAGTVLDFGQVHRATWHPDGTPESDTTHTVMLALTALVLLPSVPHMDPFKVLVYALVHDLVEAKCGDVNTAGGLTAEQRAAKQAAEARALEELCVDLAELPRLVHWLRWYEQLADNEARFIKVLDKALPKLTHHMNHCAAVRALGLDYNGVVEHHLSQLQRLEATYPEQQAALLVLGRAGAHVEKHFPRQPSPSVAVGGCYQPGHRVGDKRFYLPGVVLTSTCPHCGTMVQKRMGDRYLGNPQVGVPIEYGMYHQYRTPDGQWHDHQWKVLVQLDITLRSVPRP